LKAEFLKNALTVPLQCRLPTILTRFDVAVQRRHLLGVPLQLGLYDDNVELRRGQFGKHQTKALPDHTRLLPELFVRSSGFVSGRSDLPG
jgi:hypothetical protein